MKIDKDAFIGGVRIVAIRDFLKKYRDYTWDESFVQDLLNLSATTASVVVTDLHAEGFIEPFANPFPVLRDVDGHSVRGAGTQVWWTTVKGNALANVTFAPRVHRKTADKALGDFMNRVEEVNRDERWLCV